LHAQKNAGNADGMGVCTLARSKAPFWAGGKESPLMGREEVNDESQRRLDPNHGTAVLA